MVTRTLTGAQTGEFTSNNENYDTFDFTAASFQALVDTTTDYPVIIDNSLQPVITINGGQFNCNIPASRHRQSSYPGGFYPAWNSALLFVKNVASISDGQTFGTPASTHHGVDLFRLQGNDTIHHYVRNAVAYGWRDDIVETDDCLCDVTVEDSLFDGGFGGPSATSDPGIITASKVITFRRTLIRLTKRFADANPTDFTHGHPFKVNPSGPDLPTFVLEDTVIAIETPDYPGFSRTASAFSRMTATNCEWLVLGANQDPGHPTLPAGFTLYQGATAQARWDMHRAAFFDVTPPDPTPNEIIVTIDPDTGEMTTLTDEPFAAVPLTITARNLSGSASRTVNVSVV